MEVLFAQPPPPSLHLNISIERPTGACLLHEPCSCFKLHCKKNLEAPSYSGRDGKLKLLSQRAPTMKSKIKTKPAPWDAWGMPLQASRWGGGSARCSPGFFWVIWEKHPCDCVCAYVCVTEWVCGCVCLRNVASLPLTSFYLSFTQSGSNLNRVFEVEVRRDFDFYSDCISVCVCVCVMYLCMLHGRGCKPCRK